MTEQKPIVRKIDHKTEKKCIKCRNIHKKATHFGKHDSSDGYQSICKDCKGEMNKTNRNRNVSQYLRHHIATRCLTQLGEHAPSEFTKNLEVHLGYKITALVKYLRTDIQEREGKGRKLRDAFDEGYHVDHIYPLSKFRVLVCDEEGEAVTIDWDEFKKCWAMTNLSAIPGLENLKKGARVGEDTQIDNRTQGLEPHGGKIP